MATFLYKLGQLSFRRRHFIALIWVALLTLAGVGAAQAPVAGSIPGTEVQEAFGATGRVVFKAPDGAREPCSPPR